MNAEELKALLASIEAGTWAPTEQEEENLLTDAILDNWESGAVGIGYQNAVRHLRPLHPALRRLAISEGIIWSNMGGGGRWSDAVAHGAREIAAGRCGSIEANWQVIKNDPYGTKASAAAAAGVSHGEYLRSVGAGG